jgi:tRNA 5-methylaminomethyl-2-thiouridine biosynthesis bifunctional protein
MPSASTAGLSPAQLTFDANGVPRSDSFDDIYHSADGGASQARHVFLQGNGLPERWCGRRSFTIIETGFGLGLNFLATWAALRADPSAPTRLNYVAAEKHPLRRSDLERFHRATMQHSGLAHELIHAWPPLVRGFHRIDFDAGRVALTLLLGDATELLAELDASADALFLDGFAPEKNHARWSDALFKELARLSVAGATAATWTVAAAVRTRLANAGFRTEKRPGFGRKREMLVAQRIPDGAHTRSDESAAQKHAVIVGAGLAGVWCAHALARRGWRIDLIERHDRPAQAASGNAVGALRPALNLADNANARLARAAFLLNARQLANYPALASCWAQSGVLHVATSNTQAERMRRIIAEHAFPPDYVAFIDSQQATVRAECNVAAAAWWIPLGGWAHPTGLCAALLRLNHERITCRFGQEATDLAHVNGTWRVLDGRGNAIASAPAVVLAVAHEIGRFSAIVAPPLVCVRGQVSHLPAAASRRLHIVVCGDGYVAPLPGGGHCVGATFQPEDTDNEMRTADHVENLARLERMLPGFGSGLSPDELDGRAALRTATADRLPACGRLQAKTKEFSGLDGLYLVAGLGARGLIWAPLCAELLAARLDDEPNPVERSLAAALDPSRLFAHAEARAVLE